MGDLENLTYALFFKKSRRERALEAQEVLAREAERANDLKQREVIALEQLTRQKPQG